MMQKAVIGILQGGYLHLRAIAGVCIIIRYLPKVVVALSTGEKIR